MGKGKGRDNYIKQRK